TNLMSCSTLSSALLSATLERSLYLAWLAFLWSMVVPGLWSAKDWFRLHHNTSLRVYSLGSFLSIVVFTCSMLSSVQNRAAHMEMSKSLVPNPLLLVAWVLKVLRSVPCFCSAGRGIKYPFQGFLSWSRLSGDGNLLRQILWFIHKTWLVGQTR